VTRLALAGQQQQSLRRYCNMLMNWSERTDGYNQKVCNWDLSIQGKCEWHYWCLRICKSVCTLGSMKPNQRSQNCVERGVFRFALPLRDWLWKLFVTDRDRHWGWNMDPPLWTGDQKTVSGIASCNFSSEEEVCYLFSRESHGHCFLGCRRGDFGRHYAMWSNQ
jgi:hypothetical protein